MFYIRIVQSILPGTKYPAMIFQLMPKFACGNEYNQPVATIEMKSKNIRRFRELHNLTQEYVAEHLGISQSNYSRLENSNIKLDVIRVIKLAALFRLEPYLLIECDIRIEAVCSHPGHCHPVLKDVPLEEASKWCQKKMTLAYDLLHHDDTGMPSPKSGNR